SQLLQTLIVAVSSGIIATDLFLYATELVQHDNHKLAGVEATQSGEDVFALFGELLILSTPLPCMIFFFGMALIILVIILHSVISALGNRKKQLVYRKVSGEK